MRSSYFMSSSCVSLSVFIMTAVAPQICYLGVWLSFSSELFVWKQKIQKPADCISVSLHRNIHAFSVAVIHEHIHYMYFSVSVFQQEYCYFHISPPQGWAHSDTLHSVADFTTSTSNFVLLCSVHTLRWNVYLTPIYSVCGVEYE